MLLSIMVSVEVYIGYEFLFCVYNWELFGVVGGVLKYDMYYLKLMINFQFFFNYWDKLFNMFCLFMKVGGVKIKEFVEYEW